MNTRNVVCVAFLVASALLAAPARSETPADLVNKVLNLADENGFREAMPKIGELLRQDNSDAATLRSALQQHLAQTNDPALISRIGVLLASRPTRELIATLAAKTSAGPMPLRLGALNQLASALRQYPALDPGITEPLLQKLEAIVRDAEEHQTVVDSALLAIGACRGAGFDVLVRIWNGKEPGSDRKLNVFCTALSHTADPRALPILRALATGPMTREGVRIAAVHGVGQLCTSLKHRGVGIEPTELAACQTMLRQFLGETEDNQLFSVALRIAAKMEGMQSDTDVRHAIGEALFSDNRNRRQAALQALFQGDRELAMSFIEAIRNMAEADPDESARATAEAVVGWLAADEPS